MTYSNQRDWVFHWTGHHVRELLLHFIGRDFVLDGSSKFCAIFGPRPGSEPPFDTIFGVTSYYIEEFDVERHMTRPLDEQQESILLELTKVMMRAAQSGGSDPDVISDAAGEVRRNDFSCEIPIKKLGRSTKDRKRRVEVFRCLGPRIGEIWEARVRSRDGSVLGSEPMTKGPGYLDRTDEFSKSMWLGNVFQIENNRSKIAFSFDVTHYAEKNR